MAKRRKKKVRPSRSTGRPTALTRPSIPKKARATRSGAGPPELLLEVRRLLKSQSPLPVIAWVSGLIAATDPRRAHPIDRKAHEAVPALANLVSAFIEIETPETAALLAVAEVLIDDEDLLEEIRRARSVGPYTAPEFLSRLGETTAHRTVETVHALGDGENIVVGARLPDGQELTALVYIDHNLGTVAKDGFLIDQPIAAMVGTFMGASIVDAHTSANDIPPADARARLTEAISNGALMFPPFESETWPQARAAVQWMARLLPEGGAGYVRPEWTEKQKSDLARRFFASPAGRPLDDRERRDLLESILWYGTDYGPGDPMRWSAPAAEILLLDWIPRKIVADRDYLALAPALLSAFVRFCDAERGIPSDLTAETLNAIETFAPEYHAIVASPRLQGPAALLAAMGVIDPDEGWLTGGDEDFDDWSHPQFMLDGLAQQVGGKAALDALDTRPLPDEEFDWKGIPDDIHPRVEEVLDLCDRGSLDLFDLEFRTACRRMLARVACGDPEVFRRKGRSDTAAASLVWIVGKANDLLGSFGGMPVKDAARYFGLSSTMSQRAPTLLAAAGVTGRGYDGAPRLGSPDFLTSVKRGDLIERRDRYMSQL